MENTKSTKQIKCSNCGYEWITASDLIYVSCPSCLKKTIAKRLTKSKDMIKDIKEELK